MSLRTKLLALFGLLAVVPLIGIGGLSYVQSRRALESLVAAQAHVFATRASEDIDRRYALLRSDLLLLAGNAETQRIFGGSADAGAVDLLESERYLEEAWQQMASSYHSIELRDTTGAVRLGFGDRGIAGALLNRAAWSPTVEAEEPISDWLSGRTLGTVVARARLTSLLPREALEASFGTDGYSVVIDRDADRVLYHPTHALAGQSAHALLGEGVTIPSTPGGRHMLRFRVGDSLRIAAAAVLDTPPWTVLSTASLEEFDPPFARARFVNFALVLSVTLAVMLAFVAAINRSTRSLEALTSAADEVRRGNFSPTLPPSGRDEVGRLSSAFGVMTSELGEMVRQLARSRQMAAIGEFSAEIAHEIRNPLTSLKLNQQRLARLADAGALPAEAAEPVRISLRETRRLERVVRGVLDLGKPRSAVRSHCTTARLLGEALDVIGPQAERQGVRVRTTLDAPDAVIACDVELMRGALLNLLVNALEAMPEGGTLRVSSYLNGTSVELRIADSGAGVRVEEPERIFLPFFTTKSEGTGLGLAVAMRVVEEHGGQIALDTSAPGEGAAFRVTLPIAPADGLP